MRTWDEHSSRRAEYRRDRIERAASKLGTDPGRILNYGAVELVADDHRAALDAARPDASR